MASLLELGVSTGKWDAGIKKAQQSLNSFVQSQGGLNNALEKENEKMKTFVQMMGKMDSTAKTAKGQMNDYKRTLEELTATYNKMSDSQKQTLGPDLLNTIEAIKKKFTQAREQVKDFNQSIGEIKAPQVEVKGGDSTSGIGNMLAVFGGNMMTKAVSALTDLGAKAMDVANQSARMASAAEGVRMAFERIDDGSLLDKLREATHGTVNDLELMKAAVKFNDFKLPLDQLGTMLAFAQQKAKDTGQSVDYLVDSIVMGLGRKSLMILDNLGLSAAEVKARMAETGDMTTAVGEIIREQMQSAGDYVETAADRTQKATAEMENAMLDLGVAIQNTFNISGGVEGFETFLRTDLARTMTDVVNWLGEIKTAITEIGTSNGFEAMCNVLDSLVIPKLTGITTQLRNIKAFIDGLTGSGSGNMSMGGIAQSFRNSLNQVREQVKSALPTYTVTTDSSGKVISASKNGQDVTEEYLKSQATQTVPTVKPTTPKGGGKAGAAWAPIEMQSYNFRGVDTFGRSEKMVQADIAKWTNIKSNAEDEESRAAARSMVEKFTAELEQMKNEGDITKGLMGDAYSHNFGEDIEWANKEYQKLNQPQERGLSGQEKVEKGIGGVSQIASGLKQMGIKVPEEIEKAIEVMQGVMAVINGVQTVMEVLGTTSMATNTVALSANTAALVALTAAVNVNTGTNLIPFHNGGIVPHAATGMIIPGNDYSDRTPVLASSGELILNRAQQGVVASMIEGGNRGEGYQGTPYVEGEKIFLGINNYLRRSGRGEIVTSR